MVPYTPHPGPENTARLPPELCDAVIDCICDDREALRSSSLVCRSWLPRSRALLFPSSRIFSLNPENIHSFWLILQDPHCTLLPFVQRIRLTTNILWPPRVESYLHNLQKIVDIFVEKKSIVEDMIVYYPNPSHLLQHPALLYSLARCITSLSLYQYEGVPDGREILSLLIHFSDTLESLTLYLKTPSILDSPLVQVSAPFPQKLRMIRLRRLELTASWNDILPWFISPGQVEFPALKELEFSMASFVLGKHYLAQQFLDILCAETVEDLVLPFIHVTIPAINLSNFTALRSVTFSDWGCEDSSDFEELVTIVSTAPVCDSGRKLIVVVTDKYDRPLSGEKLKNCVKRDEWNREQ